MLTLQKALLCTALFLPRIAVAQEENSGVPEHWKWAPKPVLGWSSFGAEVTEAQVKTQTDFMAQKMARLGWKTMIVGLPWYQPQVGAELTMDQWGRLLPSPDKFPCAADKAHFKAPAGSKDKGSFFPTTEPGFQGLAEYVHRKGLKFGVQMMRGIPRQAVAQNTPILGTVFHARDIADTTSVCAWNSDMFGVDMRKLGAQDYYNSVFQQLADWGVDYVEVDDMGPPYHRAEIEAIRKAIDHTGRPMVFNAAGETPVEVRKDISGSANFWGIRGETLAQKSEMLSHWAPLVGAGHFADAGQLTGDSVAQMSLGCISRSPLIVGGDLSQSLWSNEEVLGVNQNSVGNCQLWSKDGLIAWVADVVRSQDKYLALFNTGEGEATVSVKLADLGVAGGCQVRDLWERKNLGRFEGEFGVLVRGNGAGLFRVMGK